MIPTIVFIDGPVVSISSVTSEVLEHNVGSISLTCSADSNPPSEVMWIDGASGNILQYGDMLQFTPVSI